MTCKVRRALVAVTQRSLSWCCAPPLIICPWSLQGGRGSFLLCLVFWPEGWP